MITTREGSLADVVAVVEQIDEFAHKETEASLAVRLQNRRYLLQIAEYQGQVVGFKIGYELDQDTFYSWFGGVAPIARQQGVAQLLLEEQEAWVSAQGYTQLKVKSRNQFPAMLRLLIKNGYLIEHIEAKEPLLETRIHFVKSINSEIK